MITTLFIATEEGEVLVKDENLHFTMDFTLDVFI